MMRRLQRCMPHLRSRAEGLWRNDHRSSCNRPSPQPPIWIPPQDKPISYLKSHAAEIIDSITEKREPMLITQNGEAKLVVMDVKSYEEQEETMALLKILALGNRGDQARALPAR